MNDCPAPAAPPSPAHCPRCGADNRCGRLQDPQARDCWCRQQTFTRALCATSPAGACICQACAQAALEAPHSPNT